MPVFSLVLFFLLLDPQSASVIPAGTRVEAKLESGVKTSRSAVGDDVTATVTIPVRGTSEVVVPRGSRLNGRVETVQAATRENQGRVRLVFREIELPDGRHIPTWITNAYEARGTHRARRYILWMGSGAAAGGLIGGKTARVAGVLGGLVVGFLVASNADDANLADLKLRPGQTLHLRLGEDTTVP